MSSVYQFRSSEDYSSLSFSPPLVYSPQLCLSALEKTDHWVWGLEYLSAGANTQRSMGWCVSVCVCVCMCIFIIANLSSCHSSNLVSESRSLQEYPIFTAVSTRTEKEWAGKSEKATVRRCCHVATAQHLKWCHYPATVFHNTFFVPSQNPYFKPSLLKQSYSLGDSLLKSVLYCGHS